MNTYTQEEHGRWGYLEPLYAEYARSEESVALTLSIDGCAVRCGSYEGIPEGSGDEALQAIRVLIHWLPWLRKARLGTLRWLESRDALGHHIAGDPYRLHKASTAVRSQLERAEIVTKSDIYGKQVHEDVRFLRVWAKCELSYRGVS